MTIKKILSGKKEYLELLLLADEQESMIDRYLERGEMYVLLEEKTASREKPAAVCVVTDEGGGVLELKNLAVAPDLWRRGIGRKMIAFLERMTCSRWEPATCLPRWDSTRPAALSAPTW